MFVVLSCAATARAQPPPAHDGNFLAPSALTSAAATHKFFLGDGMLFEGYQGRTTAFGYRLSLEGKLDGFALSARQLGFGIDGHLVTGGAVWLSDAQRNRVEALCKSLPAKPSSIIPWERRLKIRIQQGESIQAGVYDRAFLPDEILEVLRILHAPTEHGPPDARDTLGALVPQLEGKKGQD